MWAACCAQYVGRCCCCSCVSACLVVVQLFSLQSSMKGGRHCSPTACNKHRCLPCLPCIQTIALSAHSISAICSQLASDAATSTSMGCCYSAVLRFNTRGYWQLLLVCFWTLYPACFDGAVCASGVLVNPCKRFQLFANVLQCLQYCNGDKSGITSDTTSRHQCPSPELY